MQRHFVVASLIETVICLFTSAPAEASLVICVYNSNAVYIASDSLVAEAHGAMKYQSEKVFKLGETHMVGVTGQYGSDFIDDRTRKPICTVNLLSDLETQCKLLCSTTNSLEAKIQTIMNVLATNSAIYARLCSLAQNPNDGIALFFTGYDESNQRFFGSYSHMRGTSQPTLAAEFDSRTNSTSIYFLGEDRFLGTLLRNPERLPSVGQSQGVVETLEHLNHGLPVAEDRLVNSLMEMFALHKTYASTYTTDKGWIGEPYVIYRITKKGISKLR